MFATELAGRHQQGKWPNCQAGIVFAVWDNDYLSIFIQGGNIQAKTVKDLHQNI